MPYKDPVAARLASRERVRRYRKRQGIAKKLGPAAVELTGDPADVLAAWSASTLVVPAGHPNAGEPMTLPDYRRGIPTGRAAAPGQLAAASTGAPLRRARWHSAEVIAGEGVAFDVTHPERGGNGPAYDRDLMAAAGRTVAADPGCPPLRPTHSRNPCPRDAGRVRRDVRPVGHTPAEALQPRKGRLLDVGFGQTRRHDSQYSTG